MSLLVTASIKFTRYPEIVNSEDTTIVLLLQSFFLLSINNINFDWLANKIDTKLSIIRKNEISVTPSFNISSFL